MGPPVASDTAAIATEIESSETIILQRRHSNASKNAGHNVKLDPDAVDEHQKSTESATVSDPTLLASQVAKDVNVFRSLLMSISPDKKTLASNPSSTYTDSEYSSYCSQEGTNTNINSEVLPKEIQHLQGIADRMIAAGYSRECIEAYTSVRKTCVDEKLNKLLRIEKMSSRNLQRLEWQVQQEKIWLWIRAAKICVRGLFAGERTLTNQIFNGLGTNIADDCFIKTIKYSAIQLFNFVEAISSSRKSPEKLFEILHLYEVLSDLLPDIETIFDSESGEFIKKQAVEMLSSLSEATREILSEFEKAVFGEISQVRILGGSVHPLTEYVMNYIHDMVKHKQTLTQLIVSNPSSSDYICSSNLDFDFSEFEGMASPLVLHLVWIIVVLKFNLQGKSKQYKITYLAHLFMKNNVDYIVRKIKGSVELRQMIGDDFQNKLISLAEANFQKSTWKRTLDCFRCGGL